MTSTNNPISDPWKLHPARGNHRYITGDNNLTIIIMGNVSELDLKSIQSAREIRLALANLVADLRKPPSHRQTETHLAFAESVLK